MSELSNNPPTEVFDPVTGNPANPHQTPAPPMIIQPKQVSQTAIASFFYGTLQLLVTAVSGVLAVMFSQFAAAFSSQNPGLLAPQTGTDMPDLAELEEALKGLNITDSSGNPIPIPDIPDVPSNTSTSGTPDPILLPGMPDLSGLSSLSSPLAITPIEVIVILGINGFAVMAIFTALIAFASTGKKGTRTGRGLAVTGVISALLSLVASFAIAYSI